MPLTGKATEKQIALLLKYGIEKYPPSKVSCCRLISHILSGDGQMNFARAGSFKKAQGKWIGKEVLHPYGRLGGKGTIQYLIPKMPSEKAEQIFGGSNAKFPHPLKAFVKWEDGSSTYISLGFFEQSQETVRPSTGIEA